MFVEYEQLTGKRIVLNLDHITYIEVGSNGGTYIHLRDRNGVEVREEFDAIGKALMTGGYQ